MTLFALSYRERVALGGLAAHTEDAKVFCRANALLWLDDGESAEEVAERLRVSRQTVYNWAIRFQRRGEPISLLVLRMDHAAVAHEQSITCWSPSQIVFKPGSPSPLRPRKPPSMAIRRSTSYRTTGTYRRPPSSGKVRPSRLSLATRHFPSRPPLWQ
jgi:hypothetical protein